MLNAGVNEQQITNLTKQCAYRLTVIVDGEAKVVGYPLTCEFNISRNTSAQANSATFNIYNLAPSTRNSEHFFEDRLYNKNKIKFIKFEAGYEGKFTLLFKGQIMEAYSKSQGVDIITSIQANDWGTYGDYLAVTFEEGTNKKDAFVQMANQAKNLTLGEVGTIEGTFKTPTTFVGTPMDCLNQLTGGNTFIDNSEIKYLPSNECIEENVYIITSQSGLLGTPERKGQGLSVTTIFNPNIKVGQLVEIRSSTQQKYNDTYKVMGLSHQGVISGALGGQRTTTFDLFIKDSLPTENNAVTGETGKQPIKLVKGTEVRVENISQAAYNVYKYIREHNGQVPNWKINDKISWKEMLVNANEPNEIFNELKQEYISNCEVIANKLYNFLNVHYPGQKITINSGWRSRENNAKLKGSATESAHLRGLAIDFQFKGINTINAYNKTFEPRSGWDKFTYLYITGTGGHIHVQATYGSSGVRRGKTKRL